MERLDLGSSELDVDAVCRFKDPEGNGRFPGLAAQRADTTCDE